MHDIIFIHKIPTKAIIGIHPFERVKPQPLLISIEMGTDISEAIKNEDINKAINYDDVSQTIDQFVQQSEFKLIETLAQCLCDELFSKFDILDITLIIEKPSAIRLTQNVGVKIYRKRS